jgi:monooxygenase
MLLVAVESTHFDVIIVGAGLSGIGAAHHLQTNCPSKSFVLLEARERLGGTWDLFRYPGIRSDSDMYTLGYSFRPWTDPKAIADGPAILEYVRKTAEDFGIDRKIRYRKKVVAARWSSAEARWTVEIDDGETGERRTMTASFLLMCSGYYDYEKGYAPEFPGQAEFKGRIVHPQLWTDDVDYTNKRVVVIGSGATAVTLVPELAKKASMVTMLQRSPTYVVSGPDRDAIADWLRERLPMGAAYAATRWKNVLFGMGFYAYCRAFPERAKKFLVGQVKRRLGETFDVDTHFNPSYGPWDQRVCLVPNGDLFKTIRDGRADVVTDRIARFTETGILLESGKTLTADLVVTATGLVIKLLGGMQLFVDGARVEPAETVVYKGTMLSGVPNLSLAIGYTNASWTLKCDLTSEWACRLLNHMDKHGYRKVVPVRDGRAAQTSPLLGLTSGYVQRAIDRIPKQGASTPWKLHQNYALDRLMLERAPIEDRVLSFSRG